MLDLKSAAAALGGNIAGGNRVCAPAPGHSPRDRSLVIKFDARAQDGFVLFCHTNHDWRECRDYVRQRLGLPAWQPGDGQDRRVPRAKLKQHDRSAITATRTWADDDLKRINRARNIWADGKDPRGTLGETYLNQHRGLKLTDDVAGTVLRFHAATPWRDEASGQTIFVPALLAAFRQIETDQMTAIHRIRLNADGSKFGRMMLGLTDQAAVKITPVAETLCVAEGVETAMAARQLGFAFVWALGSAGKIASLTVIDGVKHLLIAGEKDTASAEAISICGKRWRNAGRRVQVIKPAAGKDLNDALMQQERNDAS
jgi:putative DNA primase/helicase